MTFHIVMFLLVIFLIFLLALLWRHGWSPLQPAYFKTRTVRTRLHRLLKPRPQTIAPPVVLAPLLRRVEGQCPRKSRPCREVR
jgi:hypothetical protein